MVWYGMAWHAIQGRRLSGLRRALLGSRSVDVQVHDSLQLHRPL